MNTRLVLFLALFLPASSFGQGANYNIYQKPSPFTPGATFGPNGEVYIPAPTAPRQEIYVQPAPQMGSDPSIYNQMQYPQPVPLEPRRRP